MIDLDHDPNAPWVPPGTRPFRVGDHVRIHLSRECRIVPTPGSSGDLAGTVGHHPVFDGMTGTIEDTDGYFFPGHPFTVYFGKRIWIGDLSCNCEWFAPNELELLP